MKVMEIRDVINAADPGAKHYDATAAAKAGVDFTVWMEHQRTGLDADDGLQELGWRFEVDRFTKTEYDPVADAIETALRNDDRIIVHDYQVIFNIDTGYIQHAFDCEAI